MDLCLLAIISRALENFQKKPYRDVFKIIIDGSWATAVAIRSSSQESGRNLHMQ
jgi:hypothetical protein